MRGSIRIGLRLRLRTVVVGTTITLAFRGTLEVPNPLLLGSSFLELLSVLVWWELVQVLVRMGRAAWRGVAAFGVGSPRLVRPSVAVVQPSFLACSYWEAGLGCATAEVVRLRGILVLEKWARVSESRFAGFHCGLALVPSPLPSFFFGGQPPRAPHCLGR